MRSILFEFGHFAGLPNGMGPKLGEQYEKVFIRTAFFTNVTKNYSYIFMMNSCIQSMSS